MVRRETFAVETSMGEDGTVTQRLRPVVTFYPDEYPAATPVEPPSLRTWQPSYIDADGVPVFTL